MDYGSPSPDYDLTESPSQDPLGVQNNMQSAAALLQTTHSLVPNSGKHIPTHKPARLTTEQRPPPWPPMNIFRTLKSFFFRNRTIMNSPAMSIGASSQQREMASPAQGLSRPEHGPFATPPPYPTEQNISPLISRRFPPRASPVTPTLNIPARTAAPR